MYFLNIFSHFLFRYAYIIEIWIFDCILCRYSLLRIKFKHFLQQVEASQVSAWILLLEIDSFSFWETLDVSDCFFLKYESQIIRAVGSAYDIKDFVQLIIFHLFISTPSILLGIWCCIFVLFRSSSRWKWKTGPPRE